MAAENECAVESHHRLANILQIIASSLRAERDGITDPAARKALNGAMTRILAIAQYNRHIAEHRGETLVELGQFFKEILSDLDTSTGLECTVDSDHILVNADMALQLARAVTELVVNASKHGYEGRAGGTVTIRIRNAQNGRLRLSVSDHGKGFTDGLQSSLTHGLGMSIIASIAHQLHGELEMRNDRGALFVLDVPLP